MVSNVCIYHDKCLDGFAAAWAVRAYAKRKNELNNWEFIPSLYNNPVPSNLADKNVYIVDFSYKKPEMLEIVKIAKSVTILDHHSTAFKEVGELVAEGIIRGVLDNERSGCVIAWEYLNAPSLMPALLKNIQDRDLWQFKDPRTKQLMSALEIQPRNFTTWDDLLVNDPTSVDRLYEEGAIINKVRTYQMASLMTLQYPMCIGGHIVPVINAPHFLASELGNVLAKRNPFTFAATYHDTADRRVFSLRSTPQGLDVSEIAANYGGGGHKQAAGFSTGRKWRGEEMPKLNEVV